MGSMGSSSVSTSSSNAAALADARSAFFLLTERFGAAQGQLSAHRTAAAAGSPQNCITGVHTTAQDGIQCQGPSVGHSGSGGHHGSGSGGARWGPAKESMKSKGLTISHMSHLSKMCS